MCLCVLLQIQNHSRPTDFNHIISLSLFFLSSYCHRRTIIESSKHNCPNHKRLVTCYSREKKISAPVHVIVDDMHRENCDRSLFIVCILCGRVWSLEPMIRNKRHVQCQCQCWKESNWSNLYVTFGCHREWNKTKNNIFLVRAYLVYIFMHSSSCVKSQSEHWFSGDYYYWLRYGIHRHHNESATCSSNVIRCDVAKAVASAILLLHIIFVLWRQRLLSHRTWGGGTTKGGRSGEPTRNQW